MKLLLGIISLLAWQTIGAQDSLTVPPNKQRIIQLGVANMAVTAGSMAALYNTWYKDYRSAPFHFFNDNDEWLQMDKAGHIWSAYTISRLTGESFKWAGYSHKKVIG